MFESVVSQVIAAIISAAIIAFLQFSYRKYKALNEWDKIAILHLMNVVCGILQILLCLFLASNIILKILFFIFSCISFAGASFMFFNIIRAVKHLELLIDKISSTDAKNSDNESDK